MRFILVRDAYAESYTFGTLSILYDGPLAYTVSGWKAGGLRGPMKFGDLLEDADRGLHVSLPLVTNQARKIPEVTCIPATDGAAPYVLSRTWSNRFHDRTADGKMILVHDTPAFRGIRWHHGLDARWSEGCQLTSIGRDLARGATVSSEAAWRWLDARVAECDARGEKVLLDVHRDPAAWAAAPFNPDRHA